MGVEYKDPVITKLIQVFDDNGPDDLNGKYWYGNAYILPQNQKVLPAAFIHQVADETSTDTTDADMSRKRYQVEVAVEMKKTFNKSKKIIGPHMAIQDYIGGMDEDFNHRADSLMAVIRNHRVLDGPNKLYIDISSATTSNIQPGIEARGPGIFTYEGSLSFIVEKREKRVFA